MSIREAAIEQVFVREVARHGGIARKFESPGWRGAPDRIVLLPGGKAVFVEVKAPGKKPRPLQEKRAQELRSLGFDVWCIDSMGAVYEFVKEMEA